MPARSKPDQTTNHDRPQTESGRVRPSTLLLMTCLGAVDGTVVLLASQGLLSSWWGAVGVGLTVIAGAGAWITARQAFGGRPKTMGEFATLGVVAITSSLATLAAAWLGDWVGTSISLHVLPRVAGLVLLLVAAEVGGLRLPKPGGVPLPAITVLSGLILEGASQWTHW